MTQTLTRAQFLRGDFRSRHRAIRPPWHCEELLFTENCSQCNQCIDACPAKIIQQHKNGFPVINFSKGECTFCGACAEQCPTPALNFDTSHQPWSIRAQINENCLTYKGVVCMSCADECEVSAINLKLVAGGVAIPQLKTETCNGCGACYRVCPTSAIEMKYHGEDV